MNANGLARIKPTPEGWQAISKYIDSCNKEYEARGVTFRTTAPVANKDGYITGQFWCLMQYFDWHKGIAQPMPFSDIQLVN